MVFLFCSYFCSTGVVKSENHPDPYPQAMDNTYTITMEPGMTILLKFTAFNIWYDFACYSDYLTITDGDGTTLMGRSCGPDRNGSFFIEDASHLVPFVGFYGARGVIGALPANITSKTNVVKLYFKTKDSFSGNSGWSVSYEAIPQPSECQQYGWFG